MEEHSGDRQPRSGGERQADRWGSSITREGRFAGAPSVRRVVFPLPVVMILLAVGLDLATAPTLTGSALFCAAPLVAAPFFSTTGTALVGMLSVGCVALMRVLDEMSTGRMDVAETASTAVVALLAVVINRLLRRSGAAVSTARTIAEAAQFAVLPVPPTRLGGLRIAARYRAAQNDARIGGDLYAVQETPYGVRLIVGDVRGAGMDAVGTMAVVIGAFREAAEQEPTLVAVAARLERALRREGKRQHGDDYDEGFTTAVLVELPAGRTETLRIVNCGHPSPLLLADGRVRFVDPSRPALPLGMSELGGRASDRVDETPFPHGTQLLLYTDGLSEARDGSGEFFQPDKALAERAFGDPEALLDAALTDVHAHTGGASTDDMALMALTAGPRRTESGERHG